MGKSAFTDRKPAVFARGDVVVWLFVGVLAALALGLALAASFFVPLG